MTAFIFFVFPTFAQIAESLRRFSIDETTTSLIAVKIGGEADKVMEEMSSTIDGILVSFSKLDQEKDMVTLRKVLRELMLPYPFFFFGMLLI